MKTTSETSPRPECYGKIFPDLSNARRNVLQRGKVFSAFVESVGIGIQGEQTTLDEEEWEACTGCERFDGCYKQSVAKLLFQCALRSRFS
jgi:hypothetical protein